MITNHLHLMIFIIQDCTHSQLVVAFRAQHFIPPARHVSNVWQSFEWRSQNSEIMPTQEALKKVEILKLISVHSKHRQTFTLSFISSSSEFLFLLTKYLFQEWGCAIQPRYIEWRVLRISKKYFYHLFTTNWLQD